MAKNITTIHKLLGSHIRELRNRKNYSIEKLAEKSELHPTYLGEIERATTNVSVATLEKIAKGLDTNIINLFGFQNLEEKADEKDKLIEKLSKKLKVSSVDKVKLICEVLKPIFDYF